MNADFRDCNNKEVLDAVIFVFAHPVADFRSKA
jgi:hypothetical protein